MYAHFVRLGPAPSMVRHQVEALVSKLIRKFHRWVSLAFTAGTMLNTAVIAMNNGQQPPYWLYFFALIPLFLLLLSGLYLFALPYVARMRAA